MDQNRNKKYDIWIGLAVPLVVNIALALLYRPSALFLWLIEWVYVVPLAVILHVRRRTQMAAGIWIMSGACVLINFALCGYILSSISG